jgi:hypothetical protein
MKINVALNLTTMVTGHGKTKAYLHRFNIREHATFPCSNVEQTVDHAQYIIDPENFLGIKF